MKKILLMLTMALFAISCKMSNADVSEKVNDLYLSNKTSFEKFDKDLQEGKFNNISETAAHFSAQNADYLISESKKALGKLEEMQEAELSAKQQKIAVYLESLSNDYYPTFKKYLENQDQATLADLEGIKMKLKAVEKEIATVH
ncbi:hypothetical protein QW060_07375 [Myroides ceti]|uniref:Lipoprotein n=1 Tax=Paenimyroides ceti TaxID=395087 RepID=A0ABT8CR18_9FLAO|nr:hypothetical protein [Paenimyroides ceti]MDN3706953.1 hypothetical protein [Paenimyroides ceti]